MRILCCAHLLLLRRCTAAQVQLRRSDKGMFAPCRALWYNVSIVGQRCPSKPEAGDPR